MNFVYLIEKICSLSVEALCFLMMARALLSLLLPDSDNPLVDFVYCVTEFCITPVRALCDRMSWFTESVFDVPFLITTLLLWVLDLFMP